MDFTLSAEQQAIAEVARQLFESGATPEHLADLEASEVRFDAKLWKDLASADLLGIALPAAIGGSEQGFLELCALLVEVGWAVAPVPAFAALVLGADTIARGGTDDQVQRHLAGVSTGERILTAGLAEPGRSDPTVPGTSAKRDGTSWRLTGTKELVPAAQIADAIIVSASSGDGDLGMFVVDTTATGVNVRTVSTTDGEPFADVELDAVHVADEDRLGGDLHGHDLIRSVFTRALVGLCALQLGATERALRIAAQYTSEREQFGRPIGTFQAVQQRMADAFIDVEAIRWTTWHASWRVATGRSADRDARIAKFWASEAGARVVATAQQVHGGIGIDITYPLFRYFLFAKQNELALGGASAHLASLGAAYPEGDR